MEGAKNFRKFGKDKDLKQELFLPNLVRVFAQNQVKSKKKRSSLKLFRIFAQNQVKSKNKKRKKKVFTQIWSDFLPKA